MSDDTPETPLPDDAAPTQKLPAAGTGSSTTPPETRAAGGSRGLLIALLAVGGAILIALVILLVVVLGGQGAGAPVATDTPTPEPSVSESATPEATPSESPSAEPSATTAPPPPPPAPIEAYSASTTRVDCAGGGPVPVTFRWSTSADSVTFGVGTDRADEAPYQTGLPSTGEITIDYQCGQASGQQRYAIAAISGGNVVDRETVVIRE